MSDPSSTLITLWSEQQSNGRHTEAQRANLSNLLLIIAGVAIGYVSQKNDHEPLTITVALLLVPLGTFGAITSAKYHERFQYHQSRALHYLQLVAHLYPNIHDAILDRQHVHDHNVRYGRLSQIRLFKLWILLHSGVAFIGALLAIGLLI